MKKNKDIIVILIVFLILVISSVSVVSGKLKGPPGTDTGGVGPSAVTMGSIVTQVTEHGKISLSVDGLGVSGNSGTIQVEKPAGATVIKAYMAAATTGFQNHTLAAGDIKIDGVSVTWDIETSSSITSWNYWADVTSIVESKLNAAPAGIVDFTITEKSGDTEDIDGEILAVIFDDPNQVTNNTIVLLFGAQDVNGDTFVITLAEAIDKSDPNLFLDMSLGISYGYQTSTYYDQYNNVDVNGQRMTSSAGGQDDGQDTNGALLTVGGIGDSSANPTNPNIHGDLTSPRYDDELYDLTPFVSDGDTVINVFTVSSPLNDDNIFFAALYLSTPAIIEGIILSPSTDTNQVNSQHTVTATVRDNIGPIVGRDVTFIIVSGPHAGQTSTVATNANGKATFTYTGTFTGTDTIEASFVDNQGNTIVSKQVIKHWIGISAPEPGVLIAVIAALAPGAAYGLVRRRKNKN